MSYNQQCKHFIRKVDSNGKYKSKVKLARETRCFLNKSFGGLFKS